MKLYKEIPIETAEQAEALPDMALCLGEGTWCRRQDPAGYRPPLPFQALVPIEAEEVRVIEHGLIELDVHGQEVLYQEPTPGSRDYRRTEYHTPWEEA